jgi:hypothetical protein
MRRSIIVATAVLATLVLGSTAALAGSPHFVGTPKSTESGNTLTVTGKVAGLGNEDSIFVEASAEVACLNPGEQFPNATNKQSVGAGDQFPVQNGKANFSLTLTATFKPKCSPPMTLVWGPVTITVSDPTPPASFEPFSITI